MLAWGRTSRRRFGAFCPKAAPRRESLVGHINTGVLCSISPTYDGKRAFEVAKALFVLRKYCNQTQSPRSHTTRM